MDHDAACAVSVGWTELGPYPDRIRCPPPLRSRERVVHPETHAVLDELEALDALYCEQQRIDASYVEADAWGSAGWNTHGRIVVQADYFGVTAVRPLPTEPLHSCALTARADEWLHRHRALFALGDDSTLERAGHRAGEITFRQRWRGLPVVDAWLLLAPGTHLHSRLVPVWAMPDTAAPTVSADDARAVLRASGRAGTGDATLLVWVAPSRERTHLAWLLDGCAVDALDATLIECSEPDP